MKIYNHDKSKNELKLLIPVSILILISIIGLVSFLVVRKVQNKVEKDAETLVQNSQSIGTEISTEKDTESSLKDTENESTKSTDQSGFQIAGSDEFIYPVLGSFTSKLKDAVLLFVEDNQLTATGGECLDCSTSLLDSSNTEFYIKLNDPTETLVTATYKPGSGSVEVSYCIYTLDELENQAWSE